MRKRKRRKKVTRKEKEERNKRKEERQRKEIPEGYPTHRRRQKEPTIQSGSLVERAVVLSTRGTSPS